MTEVGWREWGRQLIAIAIVFFIGHFAVVSALVLVIARTIPHAINGTIVILLNSSHQECNMAAILTDDNFKCLFIIENSASNFTEICSPESN